MKILITGASGFIGANLLQYMVDKGFEVINFDFKPPKNLSHLKYWCNVDIRNYDHFNKEFKKFNPEYVIHLAARTDLKGKSLNDYDSNTVGTQNLINIANSRSTINRVIFTSSMLVCKLGYIPQKPDDYFPNTFYGESKVQMERIIISSSHNYEWAILRPTSIWGPGFDEPYRYFFDMIINQSYFHIGNRYCTKTFGYVENTIHQIDSILNAKKESIQEKVFYLGDYEFVNIHVWANEIAQELGTSIKTIPYEIIRLLALGGDFLKLCGIKFPMTSFRLKNMTTNNIVDISNTKEIAPILPFSRIEGIKETLKWLNKFK